jgi:hypothetical protein
MTTIKYTLQDFERIKFEGFDFNIPSETLALITELASHVGSPNYIKTPIFKKNIDNNTTIINKKEPKSSENWNSVRNTFQATKIEQKEGLELKIDLIRSHLNKISDKNYIDYRNKIIDIFNELIENKISNEDMMRICSGLFEIASNNRFYSKLYADLYSDLINRYHEMNTIFENSLNTFMGLFDIIEYIDPVVNYDKFCKNNKDNEKRRSLSAFFINLMNNGVITKNKIINLLTILLTQVYIFIKMENKKNEVDELTENIAILFKKDLVENENDIQIEGMNLFKSIEHLAKSKSKTYNSLSNKSIFKYMDILDL